MSKDQVEKYVISHTETFNKYLLTISSGAFPAIGYLISISNKDGVGFKIALVLFGAAIILNMLSLILIIGHPSPKGKLDKFIYWLDWIAFAIFCFAICFSLYSIWQI